MKISENQLKSLIKEAIQDVLENGFEHSNFETDYEEVYQKISETNDVLYHIYDQYIEQIDDAEGELLEEMYNTSMKLKNLANTLGQRTGVVGNYIP